MTAAFWCVLVFASHALAQVGSTAVAEQAVGSSELSIRLVARGNLAPVKRASISLLAGSFTRASETDDAGRVDFANLPAGQYGLAIDLAYGFVRPVSSRLLTLAVGERLELTIRLDRTGAITGRIVDDGGDGVAGTQVLALRRDLGGHVTSVATAATTDDLGQFRLFNVPTGQYDVVATYTPRHQDPDASARSGYVATYYPGSTTPGDAERVAVHAGQDTPNIDFRLARSGLVWVVIHAVDSRGAPLGREAQMCLTSLDEEFLPLSTRQTSLREDGTFVFRDIPPGRYFVVATTSAAREEAAYVNLNVGTDDVSLTVQTNRGATVSGRVVIEPPYSPRRAWVSAAPPPGKYGPLYADMSVAVVVGAGRFELKGIRGPMTLSAELANGAVVSIKYRGQEIAGKTFEFNGTEVIDDVVVVLTPNVASVDLAIVNVTTTETEDPEPVLVVLFAEDPSLWHQGFLQYSRLTVGRDVVHLHLGRMVPGRYLAVAVRDPDLFNPTGSRVLARLRQLAVPLTLIDGDVVKASVGVTALS